ncbi:MAG TPA: D-arabinono-1,4-lactone oxidase [Aeromicrobium sp.]|nr:D-arabinono-1,4-lactone oxidase [Aeromicrobium sp.]
MTTWTNWANSASGNPVRVAHPATTAEVADIVGESAAAGLTVKAIGAGHSFTAIGVTNGVLLHLDRMAKVMEVDKAMGRIRVQAGISLRKLNPVLRHYGLALPNLGDIDAQSIAGAISTGTHGTGGKLHGIAKAVVGLDLVTAGGEVISVDESHELFGAARVSLGALGIITEVTLQCVPAFLLHADEQPMPLPMVLDNLDDLIDNNDHFEFFWFPHTDKTSTKRNNRVSAGSKRKPLSNARRLIDDELLSNGAFEAINQIASRKRNWVPRINKITGSVLSAREYTNDSYDVFVSPRRVRFRESEFAVPRSALKDVLRQIGNWIDGHDETITFPVEVRFAAADDIWLSTGHERNNAYIAMHQYHRMDCTRYFDAAQRIFTEHQGRPHWGKIHTLGADYFAQRYSRFDDFVALRDRLDPDRVFSNDYLDHVLG